MLIEPMGKLVPLICVAAIDGEAGLRILILGIFKVTSYFLFVIKVRAESRQFPALQRLGKLIQICCRYTGTFMMVAKYSPLMWFSDFR